jgi:hypothetical protein
MSVCYVQVQTSHITKPATKAPEMIAAATSLASESPLARAKIRPRSAVAPAQVQINQLRHRDRSIRKGLILAGRGLKACPFEYPNGHGKPGAENPLACHDGCGRESNERIHEPVDAPP